VGGCGRPSSALRAPSPRRGEGFTLIEILVVLFIISIVTTVALLSISRNENRQLETFTNELTQMLTLAEEQAMLQPTVMGLAFKSSSLQFSRYESSWEPWQGASLGKRKVPDNIELKLEVANQKIDAANKTPQIIISTNGDVTPFTIYIGKKGAKPRYAVIGDADGQITSQLLS
jgi:general secretion pathway protein H